MLDGSTTVCCGSILGVGAPFSPGSVQYLVPGELSLLARVSYPVPRKDYFSARALITCQPLVWKDERIHPSVLQWPRLLGLTHEPRHCLG